MPNYINVNEVKQTVATPTELKLCQTPANENTYENSGGVLYSTSFVSSQTGYISYKSTSYENVLAKTTDVGKTWQTVYTGKDLRELNFTTDQIGYAIVYSGEEIGQEPELVRTVNGGVDWEKVDFVKSIPVEIDCINENIVFIAASRSSNGVSGGLKYEEYILLTTDGAKTWEKVSIPEGVNGQGMSWVSPEEGYLIGTDQPWAGSQPKYLFKTSDRGKTWIKIADSGMNSEYQGVLPLVGYPDGIKFFEDGTGYIGILRGNIIKTIDDSKSFKRINCPVGSDSYPVPDFINKDEGFLILGNYQLMHTKDGGESWEHIWP